MFSVFKPFQSEWANVISVYRHWDKVTQIHTHSEGISLRLFYQEPELVAEQVRQGTRARMINRDRILCELNKWE